MNGDVRVEKLRRIISDGRPKCRRKESHNPHRRGWDCC